MLANRTRGGRWWLFVVLASVGISMWPRAVEAQTTRLYVSGTMHLESDSSRWPDPEDLVAFFLRATAAGESETRPTGMRWSIGADIGWLEGEPLAADVIAATEALGVEWDIHAHAAADRAECFAAIRDLAGTPNDVASGVMVAEIDALRRTSYASDGTPWQAGVLWGLVLRAGHRPGSDDRAYGIWRPRSSTDWKRHSPRGSLIAVGGGARTLSATKAFALALAAGTAGRGEPISSATINVAPHTLTVVDSSDGIAALEAWAAELSALPHVQWATIGETATDWELAGGVASRWE